MFYGLTRTLRYLVSALIDYGQSTQKVTSMFKICLWKYNRRKRDVSIPQYNFVTFKMD